MRSETRDKGSGRESEGGAKIEMVAGVRDETTITLSSVLLHDWSYVNSGKREKGKDARGRRGRGHVLI